MKAIILMSTVALLSTSALKAQIRNPKTETVKVSGNCDMCETIIEKAGNKKKLYQTDWNFNSKMASITYDSKKTDLDAVLKSIALSGYDNIEYLAPDDAYNKLPGCCKYEREKKAMVKTVPDQPMSNSIASMANHTEHHQDNIDNEMQLTTQLKAVYENYFALKDALVKTDGATASAKASAMLDALNAVKMETMKMDEHTTWMKIEKNLKSDAQHISENRELSVQRDYFVTLSNHMYELIKISKPAETVYYQFCPMASEGKGANWLSKESAIKNPYYGSQMLSCGKTVETIK